MKRSRGQLMLDLIENKRKKVGTPANYKDAVSVEAHIPQEEWDLNILERQTTERRMDDELEMLNLNDENLQEKPDSPLPPNAYVVAEEMSFINQVINFSSPEQAFDETPTVDNLYNNLSNMSQDSDSSTDCFNIQTITAIVHNLPGKENKSQHVDSHSSNSELHVSIPDNFSQSDIESLTPMPSPPVSFSPTNEQIEDEIDPNINSDYTDTPLSSPVSVKKRSQKKKDTGRMRERYQKLWIDEQRKFNLNRGLEYKSRTGKIRKAKDMKPACNCPRKCFEKIEEASRSKIFQNFWNLGDHTRQWDFITKYVTRLETNRVLTENSQRNYTLQYSLPVMIDGNTDKILVCKIMFLNTLSISYNFVNTALNKFNTGLGVVEGDRRGKHSNHPVKISQSAKESVCSHVKMFQPVESHYTRKETSKIYLDGSLTFLKMFTFYKKWCDENNISEDCRVKSLRQYRDIVNKNFNLSFHIPKKDKCEYCHAFENLQNPTDDEVSKHNWHLAEKIRARELKEMDKQLSKKDKTVVAVTFDLQKTQNLPHGNVSTLYYKRKLHFHNFTPFDMADLQGYCYCWDEQTAKKGANEIASCVYDFITMKVKEGVKSFRFWSDNCGGQNRNRIVFLMYMYCAWKFEVDITHRFLVVGHTQNEGDCIHSVIEKKTRNVLIYTPDQWTLAFKMATANAKPYIVKDVTQSFVFDFKSCLSFFDNWKKNSTGELVQWNKICEVNVEANTPFVINYKHTFEDNAYKNLQCLKSSTRNSVQKLSKRFENLKIAYTNVLPIDKNKFKDLQDLCKSNVIPERYHSYYNNLQIR